MRKQPVKRFILRKLVFATSAKQALHKDKETPVAEVYIDDKWEDERLKQIGFK